MKKKMIIMLVAAMMLNNPVTARAAKKQNQRTAVGTYQDYMSIETNDGNEWLLSDEDPENNPYMKLKTIRINGKLQSVYVARFQSGQKVKVKFNTMGTKNVEDDKIVSVKVIR